MPASVRPRRRTVVLGVVALAVALYGGVVALYVVGEASRVAGSCERTDADVVLTIAPETVDAVRDRIAITVEITQEGPLTATGLGFTAPVTVVASGTDGDRAYTVAADTIPSTFTMSLIADGRVEQWPFDRHVAAPQFVVVQTTDDGVRPYLPVVCAEGQVSGWTLAAEEGEGSDELRIGDEDVPSVVLTATRSPAAIAFGLVVLALMTALPVLGLTVAIAAYRGVRKVEATLMSWMAAMLFATVPLRGFLPGSPPIGSWVDYLVVLWVVGGLVAALVVYVLAWLRWTPAAGERPTR